MSTYETTEAFLRAARERLQAAEVVPMLSFSPATPSALLHQVSASLRSFEYLALELDPAVRPSLLREFPDHFSFDRLASIMAAWLNQLQMNFGDTVPRQELEVEFDFDGQPWISTTECFCLSSTKHKFVVHLPNDHFFYTPASELDIHPTPDSTRHQDLSRPELTRSWYLLRTIASDALLYNARDVFNFFFPGSEQPRVGFFYDAQAQRLDIEFRSPVGSLTLCFEPGRPAYDRSMCSMYQTIEELLAASAAARNSTSSK